MSNFTERDLEGWKLVWRRPTHGSYRYTLELALVSPEQEDAVIFCVRKELMDVKPNDWAVRFGDADFLPIWVWVAYVEEPVTHRRRPFKGWFVDEQTCKQWLSAFIESAPDYWVAHYEFIKLQRRGNDQQTR